MSLLKYVYHYGYIVFWRVYQEVILTKLGHFESTADFFVYIASISFASEPILSITSWYDKVLHGRVYLMKLWSEPSSAPNHNQNISFNSAIK